MLASTKFSCSLTLEGVLADQEVAHVFSVSWAFSFSPSLLSMPNI